MNLVIVNRYSVLGRPSGCKGPCEGTGWVPVKRPKLLDRRKGGAIHRELRRRWKRAESRKRSPDGYHFVRCPVCHP